MSTFDTLLRRASVFRLDLDFDRVLLELGDVLAHVDFSPRMTRV